MNEGFEIQCLPGMAEPLEVMSPNALAYPDEEWFFEAVGGRLSDAGVRVNPVTALSHGPVWQAVNILAGDVGQLPLHVMKVTGRNREKYRNHPVEWLLNHEPNETQTPSAWKETMMCWRLLWGNACCYIERDGSGRPTALIPLLPDRTRPKEHEMEDDYGNKFRFMVIETEANGKRIPLLYEDVYHLPGLAIDGFWGLSVVEVAKNVIGHGMALEKHGNKLFSNGARPSGVLKHPGKLTPEARDNLRKEWYAVHGGVDNAAKIAILMEGMEFNPMSMSSKDAEWMEDRKFDREQIASLFNLPAFKLNALENSAVRANLEEQNRDYFNTSLSRHLNKFREEGERKLLNFGERREGKVFLRWFPEAFLRGDTVSRFTAYGIAITHRFMSPNEVREKEDMNPYEGGDEFLNPAIEQTRPAESGESQPDDGDSASSIARNLMVVQVSALLETEAKTLEKQCGPDGPRNIVKWAENYYEGFAKIARNFLLFPAEIAVKSGFKRCDWIKAAHGHARQSLNDFLASASITNKDGLAEAGRELADAIRSRTEEFTSAILGEHDA